MIIPPRLQPGDLVEIIAPSASLARISEEERQRANQVLQGLGLRVRFSQHAHETDGFYASPVASRVADLHAAFADPQVKAILPVTGGYNVNDIFPHIDWELLRNNPKIICGFSDITALTVAISARCGFVTYAGPFYASFGGKTCLDYTVDYFKRALFTSEPIAITPAEQWSNSRKEDALFENPGPVVIREGEAEGTLWGGNLLTLNLLQGTLYFPDLQGSILFIEDDDAETLPRIRRGLQALMMQPGFEGIKGLVFGRFQTGSQMSNELLQGLINEKLSHMNIPIITGLDFGHTVPLVTLPIGGKVRISALAGHNSITLL